MVLAKSFITSAGTGLGLALCQRLVGAMKGRFSLDGEEGRGSCFTFTIPLDSASKEEITAQKI